MTQNVFGPGLYYIGIANSFVHVDVMQQLLRLEGIKTYSSDYYQVQATIQVAYQIENSSNFDTLSTYYINFGDQPELILAPLIKNQLVLTLSSFSSQMYQSNTITSNISTAVANALNAQLSAWTPMNI